MAHFLNVAAEATHKLEFIFRLLDSTEFAVTVHVTLRTFAGRALA
jgi:hypothetical protein